MKYTHLIITKVNVKWYPQAQDAVWVKNRHDILNNVLRPSLEAQTNKNFKFITLWGSEPKDPIECEYPIIIDSEGGGNILREAIEKSMEFVDDDHILTTRVDSDNALGENFVETIQDNITENVPFYYDVIDMHYFDSKRNERSIWKIPPHYGTSAFISVMERKGGYECIPYRGGHQRIGNQIKGIKLDLDCLVTIHGENILQEKIKGSNRKIQLNKFNIK